MEVVIRKHLLAHGIYYWDSHLLKCGNCSTCCENLGLETAGTYKCIQIDFHTLGLQDKGICSLHLKQL